MQRNSENPIITPDMVKPSNPAYRVRGAFNPGAVRFGDEIILLLRVAEDCLPKEGFAAVPTIQIDGDDVQPMVLEVDLSDPQVQLKDTRGIVYRGVEYLSTMSHIRMARSTDGIHFTVEEKPFLFASSEETRFGVEDARITQIGETYYINYTAVSPDGWATTLASTEDFISIESHGIIFPPENKDVSIFPERINGNYVALHRPNNSGFGKPSIWYADSPDLIHWGNHACLIRPREMIWEEIKIGGGAPSILTERGWLQIYHGKGRDQIYSLFLLLLDREDPRKILFRAEEPLLKPEYPYEQEGFFGNVVFSNGLVVLPDGRVLIYYGACDEYTCALETSVEELLALIP